MNLGIISSSHLILLLLSFQVYAFTQKNYGPDDKIRETIAEFLVKKTNKVL
jgi:hypothetical protein